MAHLQTIPLNEWVTRHKSEVVWYYRHAPTYSQYCDDFMLVQFPDSWEVFLNGEALASADTLKEAKDICPMLVKLHGRTSTKEF